MENNDVFTLDSLSPEPEPKIQVLVNGEVTDERALETKAATAAHG